MKRLALLLAVLLGLAFPAGTAAHVHGVTPLSECDVDNANSGGLRADDEDNPITGFIPTAVGAGENGNIPDGPADDRVQCPGSEE
jgi:hypothetical protein